MPSQREAMQGLGQDRMERIQNNSSKVEKRKLFTKGEEFDEESFKHTERKNIENRDKDEKELEIISAMREAISHLPEEQKMILKGDRAWLQSLAKDAVQTQPDQNVQKLLKNSVSLAIDTHIVRENINLIGEKGRQSERLRLEALSALAHELHKAVPPIWAEQEPFPYQVVRGEKEENEFDKAA